MPTAYEALRINICGGVKLCFSKARTSYTPVKHTYILLSSLDGDIEDIGDKRARFSSA